ncbi:MAG: hypothetical protein L0196_01350 [candidate division Zixibacteria bacterium]|nr:hypothetical protein [candidate division Zixibacteria bacterium]
MKRGFFFGFLYVVLVHSGAEAFIIGEWKNYTNTNDVRGFAYAGGYLWVATTGGLVKFNPTFEARQVFTNAEGLGGNFLLSVAADGRGNVWAGADNGTLTKYDLARNRFTVYPMLGPDGRRLKLSVILPDSDRLWIGTDIGVALFLTERNGGEMKEIYRRLGSINIETPVRALALFRDSIWAATPQGVAQAYKNGFNLLDSAYWRNPSAGLTNKDAYSLLVFQDTLLVGTSVGIFAYLSDSARFRVYRPHLGAGFIASMVSLGDTLYSPWQYGLVRTVDGIGYDLLSDTIYGGRIFPALFVTPQNQLFAGTPGGGFARWRGSFWSIYRPPGPPGNYFDDLAVDGFGRIWCANDRFGASMFDGVNWKILDTVPQMAGLSVAVDLDQAGNKWYGFWGGAATVAWGAKPDSFFRFDTLNSPLVGIPGFNFYILVTDVADDYQGNVWFANSLASNGQALVVRKPDGSFTVFNSSDGFDASNDIVALFPDGDNIWIAFKPDNAPGIGHLNFGGTVSNKSDDRLVYYNKEDNFLLDNRVTAIVVDRRGTLWAGTGLGLSRFNADFSFFETVPLPQPVGPQVNSIVVDPRNNKWVGTTNGLAVITEEGEIFGPFLPENSGLVASLINAMDFDPETGYLWIGTAGGLSRLSTQVLEESTPPSMVEAFPNPFLLKTGSERVYFRGLPLEATLHIYTIAGEEVRRLVDTDFWDGKNSRGNHVASGVYLFLVNVPGQKNFTGKLAVIRQF